MVRSELLERLLEAHPHLPRHAVELALDAMLNAITAGLEMLGTEATALLVERLGSSSSRIRAGAAEALGLIGDATSAPELEPLLADPEPSVRFEAIVALGQLEGEAATTAIARSAGSSDGRVVQIAGRLLSNRRATAASG